MNSTPNFSNDNQSKDELDILLRKLRPFQREGFEFATRRRENGTRNDVGRILLADEMGLGKTVTSLAIMLAYKSDWPLLILCPASLRYTWPAEIEKFYPSLSHSAVYIVKGFDDCDFLRRSNIKIVIATYSLLQNRSAAAKVLEQFQFKCVIVDESHNLKEKNSQRCKLAMPLLKGAKRLVLLSGTPALARPVELWTQLHCLNADAFGSYSYFTKRYCNARRGRFGWDVSGLSNADELHEKLKSLMVRRLKADVLQELPPKQRSIVPVKIQNKEHVKICSGIVSELNQKRVSINSIIDDYEASSAQFEARCLLMQAYQASGTGKAEGVASYLLDWLNGSGTQKVLVFAHHTEVLDTIEASVSRYFKGSGHIRIDGSVSSIERARRVKSFQSNPQIRVGLLSMTAAGVGLTLTAASTVIFAELHWTPGVLAQAEDRTHRIGQVNSVHIIYCICKERDLSVDMSLWSMLGRKVNNVGRMIDGDKNASLNAGTLDNGTSEQQLASFFADNSPSNSLQKAGTPIVKGSIQSFFVKKTDIAKAEEVIKESSSESWSCHACTFLNKISYLACSMCGTLSTNSTLKKSNTSSSNEMTMDISNEIEGLSKGSERKFNNVTPQSEDDNMTEAIELNESENHDIPNLICFSVSPNTGRIALYDTEKRSFDINFDIDDVVTDHTAESIQMKRTIAQRDIEFKSSGINRVVTALLRYFDINLETKLIFELKEFLKSFILLREIEKKAIREYGIPIAYFSLHKTLKNILFTSAYSVDRYCGGSKERSLENLSSGTLNKQDKAVLDGQACAWCGNEFLEASLRDGVKRTYCSQTCADEGRLKRGGIFASSRIRQELFTLERGQCVACGIDAHALFLRIQSLQPAERLNVLCSANWNLPKNTRALNRLLQSPKEGDFWQADHIKAVSEGGGSCGMENFRTLCVPCHQNETQKLKHRLRLKDDSSTSNDIKSDTKRSMDLRMFFAKDTKSKEVAKKRPRTIIDITDD